MRQVGLKLLQLVPVLFLVSVATFSITELLPGDPAIAILGENATPETIAALRQELRLDKPLVTLIVAPICQAPPSSVTWPGCSPSAAGTL